MGLSGCETLQFYTQGASGQIEILQKSQANQELVSDPGTTAALRQRLLFARELTDFATNHLALPGNRAYQKYADLQRDHVVHVLHAAPEFSLEPRTWYYPFLGELDYRGYFSKTDAESYAQKLRSEEGLEVHLGGTDAYSTLGVFHDPLLNTFIDYPEINFAETIFHELTHHRIFKKNDTTYNESLANTVAEEGIRRYLTYKNRPTALADYEQRLSRRRSFFALVEETKIRLTALYASGKTEAAMRKDKSAILATLKNEARDLQTRWGTKQLESWLATDLTNAHLLSLATYNQRIPEFQALLKEHSGDLESFFQALEKDSM